MHARKVLARIAELELVAADIAAGYVDVDVASCKLRRRLGCVA